MRTWKTLLLSGAILAAAGTAVGIMMNQAPEPEKAEAEEIEWHIESTRVEAGFYRPEIRLVGHLEAKRQQTFTTPLNAEVMELAVTEGARVQAGDLLLRLDDERRLHAEAVDILGIAQQDNNRWLIVHGPDLAGDPRLLTTRLNNPITGMLVHEPGVDPDPEPLVDADAEKPAGVRP